MVLREIDAGGTACRAAIESGDDELQHEVLAAAGAVSAEFGELEFLLADLAGRPGRSRTAWAARAPSCGPPASRSRRQSADGRVIREELAVMAQRPTRQWTPGPGGQRARAGPRALGGRLPLPRAAALRPGP